VTLFGEDNWARFERLRDAQLALEAEGRGQRNIFQNKLREMQREDAARDAQVYAGAVLPRNVGKISCKGTGEVCDYDVDEDGVAGGRRVRHQTCASGTTSVAAAAPGGEEVDNPLVADASCAEDFVYLQIRRWVGLWQDDVESMAREVRRTNRGRSTAATLEQTKEWFKPLYKQLRKRKLPQNILVALVNIFKAVEEREYVRANSYYYEQLAIGNAPWPMGATMVGIHARAAREKIGEGKIAHVMNDEQSRKYIQGVKRLITKAQTHFPTVPSKMISS
jgi:hypothetical protein